MATSSIGTISSPGVGSNLDVSSIVSKLMEVEQQPLTLLQNQQTSFNSQLSAIGTVKSALSTFQTAAHALSNISTLQSTTVTAANTSVLTATGTGSASTGSYSLEVTQLAQAQKLVTAGQADLNSTFSTGTITFEFGTIDTTNGSFDKTTGKYTDATFTNSGAASKTITIDSSNNTLAGIRDAINNAGIGVTASIVNDGSSSPYRLVLTEANTGKTSSMKISVDNAGSLQNLLANDPANNSGQALTETVSAQNAQFNLDGIAITKSSNTVTDVIDGVTLNLQGTNTGSPTKVTVARDPAAITSAVNQLVTSYNKLETQLKTLTSYDATTKTAGPLNGDITIRSLQSQIDNMMASSVNTGSNVYTALSQIGVTKQSDGTLALDSSKLQTAVTTNYNAVAQLFSASGTPSDSMISYSSSTDATIPGSYAVYISAFASQGKTVGSTTPALNIDSTNNTLQIQLDGVTSTITLDSGSYGSLDALAAQLQSKINGNPDFTGVKSSVSISTTGGVLTLTSNRYGSASNVSITGGNGQANLVGSATSTAGNDVAGTINGVAASGSGQYLTGANGDNSEGLKLKVTGSATGNHGTVTFGKGYGTKLDTLLTSILADDGPLAARTDGINASLKRIDTQTQKLNDRLTTVEANYRAQFTALDTLMGSLNTTSTFLTQQLAALSKN